MDENWNFWDDDILETEHEEAAAKLASLEEQVLQQRHLADGLRFLLHGGSYGNYKVAFRAATEHMMRKYPEGGSAPADVTDQSSD